MHLIQCCSCNSWPMIKITRNGTDANRCFPPPPHQSTPSADHVCTDTLNLACSAHPLLPARSVIFLTFCKRKATTVTLTAFDVLSTVTALLHSGSAGNIISESLCQKLKLKKECCLSKYFIKSIIGKPLGSTSTTSYQSTMRTSHCWFWSDPLPMWF